MKIVIEADAKEIADLVLALRDRHVGVDFKSLMERVRELDDDGSFGIKLCIEQIFEDE